MHTLTTEQLATIVTLAVVAEGLKNEVTGDYYMRRFCEEVERAGFDISDVRVAMGAVRL